MYLPVLVNVMWYSKTTISMCMPVLINVMQWYSKTTISMYLAVLVNVMSCRKTALALLVNATQRSYSMISMYLLVLVNVLWHSETTISMYGFGKCDVVQQEYDFKVLVNRICGAARL